MIDKTLCQVLWGDNEINWEMQPTTNNAGGLLFIWSDATFKMEKVKGNVYIYLEGIWVDDGGKVNIINIYSLWDINSKRILWDGIRQLRVINNGSLWCILGDFNFIQRSSERVGRCLRIQNGGSLKEYNDWIVDLEVEGGFLNSKTTFR